MLQNRPIMSFLKAKPFLTLVNQVSLLFFLTHFQQFISHLHYWNSHLQVIIWQLFPSIRQQCTSHWERRCNDRITGKTWVRSPRQFSKQNLSGSLCCTSWFCQEHPESFSLIRSYKNFAVVTLVLLPVAPHSYPSVYQVAVEVPVQQYPVPSLPTHISGGCVQSKKLFGKECLYVHRQHMLNGADLGWRW